MTAFERDRAACLALYLREPPTPPLEGLRDALYQAWLRLSAEDPDQTAAACGLLREAPWGPCPYSGVPAVQILTAWGDRLPPDVRALLLSFLREGQSGWLAELEKGACNSFRLLAAASLLGCGLLLEDREAAGRGEEALAWTEAHLEGYDLPDEFLSPFYTGLQLSALAVIRMLPVGDSARDRAARLEALLWRGVLGRFQPGLPLPSGPYARGYTTELAGHFQILSACLLGLLGEEAGFSLQGTLWNDDYVRRILPHGTVENMRCYALYFSAMHYQCREEDLAAWRRRAYPLRRVWRSHTDAARDVSIKSTAPPDTPWEYPAGEVRSVTVQEEGFTLGWADREFENGMACSSLHLLYTRDGCAKTCFLKLVRAEDRYIGEWNDYPNLNLRLGPGNFPDDGRKTVEETAEGLRITYRPRAFCRDEPVMKLALLFPTHFSAPDEVRVGAHCVGRWDGADCLPLEPVTVRDGAWAFTFRPLTRAGFWRVVCRNRFLHVEWVQRAEDGLAWPLLFTWRRLPPGSGT